MAKKRSKIKKMKGVVCMPTAISLREDEDEDILLQEMRLYLNRLQIQIEVDPLSAKQDAHEALMRTGITTKNGKIKKTIISWE